MVKHCVSGPEAQYVFEGHIEGEANALRLVQAMAATGAKFGYFHPPDRFGLQPDMAIKNLLVHADRINIPVYDDAGRQRRCRQWANEQIEKAVPSEVRRQTAHQPAHQAGPQSGPQTAPPAGRGAHKGQVIPLRRPRKGDKP